MAKKPTQERVSPDPPIHTADGKIITVGMIVYGVDTQCNKDHIPKIEQLEVIQVDLGPRRMIRLLRKNGSEWTWSAQERRGSCRTSEQLVYARRKPAVAIAKTSVATAIQKEIDTLNEKYDIDLRKTLKQKIARLTIESKRELQSNIYQMRQEYARGQKQLAEFKKKLKAIK